MCQGTGIITFPADGCKDANGTAIVATISIKCLRTPHLQEAIQKNRETIYTKQVWMASR